MRSYQTIQKWEKGERTLTYRYMVKIARALGHAVKREKDVIPLFFPPAAATEVDPVLLLGALFLRGNLENLLQGSNRIEADNLR